MIYVATTSPPPRLGFLDFFIPRGPGPFLMCQVPDGLRRHGANAGICILHKCPVEALHHPVGRLLALFRSIRGILLDGLPTQLDKFIRSDADGKQIVRRRMIDAVKTVCLQGVGCDLIAAGYKPFLVRDVIGNIKDPSIPITSTLAFPGPAISSPMGYPPTLAAVRKDDLVKERATRIVVSVNSGAWSNL